MEIISPKPPSYLNTTPLAPLHGNLVLQPIAHPPSDDKLQTPLALCPDPNSKAHLANQKSTIFDHLLHG